MVGRGTCPDNYSKNQTLFAGLANSGRHIKQSERVIIPFAAGALKTTA
jgi:hypothetical protein